MSKAPEYASQVPVVPVDWQDRDNMTARILEVLEAVMPEGRQLEATKNLVKEVTKQYFIHLFNYQFDALSTHLASGKNDYRNIRDRYFKAIWEAAQTETSDPALGIPTEQKAKDLADAHI